MEEDKGERTPADHIIMDNLGQWRVERAKRLSQQREANARREAREVAERQARGVPVSHNPNVPAPGDLPVTPRPKDEAK